MTIAVITCDEIIDAEETKPVTTNFNEKNTICKTKDLFILLSFLLIAVVLLIAVSNYCFLIKYKSKQNYVLPSYVTKDKLIIVFFLIIVVRVIISMT